MAEFSTIMVFFALIVIELILSCISDASHETRERFKVSQFVLLVTADG